MTNTSKDKTDKMWSYKSKGVGAHEFAFDPKTTTKLNIWIDIEARHLEKLPFLGVLQHSLSNYSTALDRVFSGCLHVPKSKITIRSEDDLGCFVRWLQDSSVLIETY